MTNPSIDDLPAPENRSPSSYPKESDPLLVVKPGDEEDVSENSGETEPMSEDGTVFENMMETITEGAHAMGEVVIKAVTDSAEAIVEQANELTENFQEAAETAKEEMMEEANEIRDAFFDELETADEGENFFLEMTLTRNLSLLPEDIVELAEEIPLLLPPAEGDSEARADVDVKAETEAMVEKPLPENATGTPVSAYILLAATVVALASFGPVLDLQENVSGSMKTVWRYFGTSIAVLPGVIYEVYKYGLPSLNFAQSFTFLLAITCYAIMGVGFVVGLEYTSVGTAVILANSQALILLMGKIFVGQPIRLLEGAGALIAFSGAVLCSKDSASAGAAAGGTNPLLGDLIVFLCCGVAGVGFLVFAKSVRTNVKIFTYMFTVMFVGALMILPFQIFVLKEEVTLGLDYETGLWGWLDFKVDRLVNELIQIFFCNGVGTLGYIACMQYFDSLVIAVAVLMQPVCAEFMAFALGISPLPGWLGWVGNFFVIAGTVAVVLPPSTPKKSA